MKFHPDWPGYAGDENGNVYSRLPGRKPRTLKPWVKRCGHHCVSLRRDGKTHPMLVHRFILELFVGPCPEGMEGCHGKEGPAVNAVSNIRWDTRQENHKDRFRHGERYGKQKMSPEQIDEAKRLRREGWTLKSIGERYGVTGSNIWAITKGRTWGILAEQ